MSLLEQRWYSSSNSHHLQLLKDTETFLLKQKEMVATAKFIKGRAARAQQAALAERKRKALEADAAGMAEARRRFAAQQRAALLRRQGEQEAYALQRVNQVRNFAATRDFTRSQAAEAAERRAAAAATIETRTLAGGSSVRPGQPTYEQIKRRWGALEPRITASTALLRDAARNYKHQVKLVGWSQPALGASRSLPSLPALKPSPEELAAEADAAQAKFLAPREVMAGGGALTKSERALPV